MFITNVSKDQLNKGFDRYLKSLSSIDKDNFFKIEKQQEIIETQLKRHKRFNELNLIQNKYFQLKQLLKK